MEPSAPSLPDPPSDGTECHRQWERLRSRPGGPVHLVAELESEPRPVPVRDVSPGGVNLVLSRPLPPRSILPVTLRNPDRPFKCPIAVQVIYNRDAEGGQYLVGAAFLRELTDREIEGLF